MSIINTWLFILIIKQAIFLPLCKEGKNNCTKCNYLTNLCIKCDKDIFIPDLNGGCEGAKKCISGDNYCKECEEDSNLCKVCDDGYYPDENGGCSYTNYCEISEHGQCIKCKDNYILIGENTYLFEGFILCKSINSEDFKNCEEINKRRGMCSKCKKGFYLNIGDHRCIETANCTESSFGKCKTCNYNYYLDKKDNACKIKEGKFLYCKETLDGKTCDICEDGYYFDENGNCADINFCSKAGDSGKCEKCIDGYYFSIATFRPACTKEQNCYSADKDSGLCLSCDIKYYLDYRDGKCKSNREDNQFKFCRSSKLGLSCDECIGGYYLGEDLKCSETNGCKESNKGICESCLDNYYLGLDNKCSLIEHCIYSIDEYICEECEDGYYYNETSKKCILAENEFENCKIVNSNDVHCSNCKDDFYLNRTDNLCYSNKEFGDFYKCAYVNKYEDKCAICIKDYYYVYKYHICSPIEGCEILKDIDTCEQCEEDYCLDLSDGKCYINWDVINEEKLFYFRCNRTNKEGTECEICNNGLILDEHGMCVEKNHCEEEKDGICQKCFSNEEDIYYYCINSYFGCTETGVGNCLECNDIYNFNNCTKCLDGFKLDGYGNCDEIEE